MSMDELGNVYISNGQGIMAFDPSGTNILRIPTGSWGDQQYVRRPEQQNLVYHRSGRQSHCRQDERKRRSQLVTR